ncbi:zinc ribbon domain-containing protein [Butyricicoccus faecihominis]|uniref:zinc ribbon domain-containing protein n=1 Tax=Butyricicoccaceae TaxID=3085642 RepID=UPI0024793E7F|nr:MULTISPECIES: zinc ribbon domain-containing protein [Butyricicoccaceae]MCQ5131372.1 zinc ribbon domain-containing protein [Butyricicoccus faecihominis]WNX83057.1 zinc ribbon domain-containing protein [Agathobaculum sp. NTUH-O15-33]
MKTCPICGAQEEDQAAFCTKCGAAFAAQEQSGGGAAPPHHTPPQYAAPQAVYNPFDHTAEFTAKDISENKVVAMLCYLMGTLGVIIALLGSHTSPYAAFHVRQSLKFTVLDILLLLIGLIFFWTVLVPIACAICYVVLGVVRIICFFSICKGNAKEPPIVRSFGFLR